MANPAKQRLMKDLKRLEKDATDDLQAAPDEKNIFIWEAFIHGGIITIRPSGTPFEDGIFKLEFLFSNQYPSEAPKVKFLTKMFHPNIYEDGRICLDILAERWSPTYDVLAILQSLQALLTEPNPDSPANVEASQLYKENRKAYDARVKALVEDNLDLEESDDDDE